MVQNDIVGFDSRVGGDVPASVVSRIVVARFVLGAVALS
jgi:hypothetical protein